MTDLNLETNKQSNQKLQTTVRLEAEMFAKIDKLMLSTGESRAAVVRRLMKIALKQVEIP